MGYHHDSSNTVVHRPSITTFPVLGQTLKMHDSAFGVLPPRLVVSLVWLLAVRPKQVKRNLQPQLGDQTNNRFFFMPHIFLGVRLTSVSLWVGPLPITPKNTSVSQDGENRTQKQTKERASKKALLNFGTNATIGCNWLLVIPSCRARYDTA